MRTWIRKRGGTYRYRRAKGEVCWTLWPKGEEWSIGVHSRAGKVGVTGKMEEKRLERMQGHTAVRAEREARRKDMANTGQVVAIARVFHSFQVIVTSFTSRRVVARRER